MSTCINPAALYGSPLSSKVALFNEVANKHLQNQAVNPFSNDYKPGSLPKPKISKEEYGRPARGSLSEARGIKAIQQVSREMLELCEFINSEGEPLFSPEEKANDPRVVISFGELFSIYTVINDKLVGLLLRARKHKLVDFEGECLFQRRDDHVPIILIKPIKEIREQLRPKYAPTIEKPCEEEGEASSTSQKSDEDEGQSGNAANQTLIKENTENTSGSSNSEEEIEVEEEQPQQ